MNDPIPTETGALPWLTALVELSSEAMFAVDTDGCIVVWNAAAEVLLGHAAADVVGRALDTLLQASGLDDVGRMLTDPGRTGRTSLETAFAHPDGDTRNVVLDARAVRDGTGQLVGVALVAHASRREVDREAARLRAAFEQAPFAFQIYHANGLIKSANARWYELWNAAPDALDGYNVFEDPQVDALGMREVVQRAFAGEPVVLPPLHYDPSRSGRQADTRWIRVSFYPLRDEHGEVFEVVEVTDDVTALMEAQASLERAAELERLAVASAGLGIWDYDIEADCIAGNERARTLIGPHDPQAPLPSLLARVVEDDRERVRSAMRSAVAPDGSASCDVEFQVIVPDGDEPRWLRATAQCLFRHSGALREPVRLVGVLQDTTEQHNAARRKDDYLAMLGHELRNPLAAIRTAAELMKAHGHETTLRAHVTAVLDRQTRHMARLLDGLLDVSRIARGKVNLERTTVDLAELLREVEVDRQHDAVARRVTLDVDTGQGPLLVDGDPVRLRQVFDNLVGNALKFTPGGGAVTVDAETAGDHVVVRVRDTGVGFQPQQAGSLFEAFEQGVQDLARQSGGLGLGLALARGLVALHGGHITGASEGPGRGATFTVTLPVVARDVGLDVAASSAAGADSGLHLLVVEDNADAATMMRLLLERRGHDVTLASHAELALELAANDDFDAIICDIGLPGPWSGLDVAQQLRATASTQRTPLAAVTGYGRPEDRERCLEAGFDAHFTKPVDIEVLDETLVRLVAARGAD